METWYWGVEYGKVMLGYVFFMFLWPSVVFNGHLEEKSKTYRFSFCVTVQVVLSNTFVLVMGLFHILQPRVIAVLFYGSFILALIRIILQRPAAFRPKEIRWAVRIQMERLRARMGEYGLLILLLLFGIIYFSYGAFQVHSYGFGDLYAHHAWIYGLKEGKIFADGVYPEAMHCFIYCLNSLFGVRIYSCLLFLQGIHVAVLLLAGYLLMREIFHWRYTPLLALTLFLTLDVCSADLVYGMFRLQITLPLEFGLYTQFLCALFLLRYLKYGTWTRRNGRISKYFWDNNLFLFVMSLAASVSIHFYTTIMAFVLCLSFAVFMWKRLFMREYLIPLAVSVLCACTIAVFPMAGALASGMPFNYSINWAVNSMDGEETRELEEKNSSDEPARKEQAVQIVPVKVLTGVYTKGYSALYGTFGANIILLVTGAAIALCVFPRKKSFDWLTKISAGYPPLLLFTFLFVLLYTAPYIGFPEIISDSRFCSVGHMMMMALVMIPADVMFSLLIRFCRDGVLQAASLLSAVGIYGLAMLTGHLHGYLFYELSRYNAAVDVTELIMEKFPKKRYVVVSPTDELYHVIESGWHEELVTFVERSREDGYKLAAEHVFIYVEKKPLQYAQAYFFDGPSWLAQTKYKELYWDKYSKKYPNTGASQAPEINASEISEEEAKKDLVKFDDPWYSYIMHSTRTNLEAKAYDWCQKFSELHPGKLNTYYEDDDFVCYYFSQGEGMQYNLGLE